MSGLQSKHFGEKVQSVKSKANSEIACSAIERILFLPFLIYLLNSMYWTIDKSSAAETAATTTTTTEDEAMTKRRTPAVAKIVKNWSL